MKHLPIAIISLGLLAACGTVQSLAQPTCSRGRSVSAS